MTKLMKRTAAAVVGTTAVAGSVLLAGPAFADDPATPEAAVSSGFASMQTLIVGTVAAAFFTLLIAIVGIRVGAKWVKRGAGQ